MTTLSRDLRKDLEHAIGAARTAAEAGAAKALTQLGVGAAKAPAGLSPEQVRQRNALRAHGRQLGDRRDAKTGVQSTAHLRAEVAYQHWHRMLFARFLAENELLIEPESGQSINLADCRELARELGEDWLALAARYAERMLPAIFRSGDPALALVLPPETRSKLEDLMKALPAAVFAAEDSLGWVYQYWQAENKKAINQSETKIGADELPAVTQLFTEDYMVWFLLHNTLGAWWAGKVLAAKPELATSATSEDALRAACRVGDVTWPYLRFVREEGKPWRPAAGSFEGWPKAAKDIRLLDPCMGSGHFLVFALPLLAAMRAAEEGLTQEDAIAAVLRDNLYGLEIDPRCTQIAAFNLALAAWRRVGFRPLPALHLACSGLSLGVSKAEWLKLAERAAQASSVPPDRDPAETQQNHLSDATQRGFENLYDLFVRAPWLGSLIDPAAAGGDLVTHGFKELEPLLAKVLQEADGTELAEMAVAAQGLAKAEELLAGKFTLVATNVPYLGQGKQDDVLATYCEERYFVAKADLATCIAARCIKFATHGGSTALVTPQNWTFLVGYKEFRKAILEKTTINLVVRLGAKAFRTPMWDFNVMLVCLTQSLPCSEHIFAGWDVSDLGSCDEKSSQLRARRTAVVKQNLQINNPKATITLSNRVIRSTMADFVFAAKGICTGDRNRFVLQFWEIPENGTRWQWFRGSTPAAGKLGGYETVLRWDNGCGEFYEFVRERLGGSVGAWIRGSDAWGRHGVMISRMASLPSSPYFGELFDDNCAVLIPLNEYLLVPLWKYVGSDEFRDSVRSLNQKLSVDNTYLASTPWDPEETGQERLSPLPRLITDDPTQWIFHGHPKPATAPLQVAVARLLDYRWPAETDAAMELSDEARAWIAESTKLAPHADADGIVALDPVQGEAPAAKRLIALLADACGRDWSAAKLAALLADADCAGKTLDDWLRDAFFAQHCKLFHNRPFVWHVWDGRRDGFHALVNYHRLAAPDGAGRRTLSTLTYTYLGDWIDRQRAEQKAGKEGADGRLAAAEHLQKELAAILAGEPPYDLFVRWKPLAEQPIGWDPDINDGVRLNIRPFLTARPYGARAKGACILRVTPNIKWNKDRGKEPVRERADYPWFWGWDEATEDFQGGQTFDGKRWNDLHYHVATKQAARAKASKP